MNKYVNLVHALRETAALLQAENGFNYIGNWPKSNYSSLLLFNTLKMQAEPITSPAHNNLACESFSLQALYLLFWADGLERGFLP